MDLSRCRDRCQSCATICVETAIHSLAKAEPHPRDFVRLLWDCSEVCVVTANFLSRGSSYREEMCRACSAICSACAANCQSEDPILKRCAEACHDCARQCREIVEAESV